jgi:deoxyribonuclease-4
MKRIGRHMPTHSRAIRAAEIAQQIGCNAIQIFTSNPRSWQPTADDAIDYGAFAQATHNLDLCPVVIHAPYLINLASPDEEMWVKSINLLRWTLQRGALLGAQYVVFHTGSHRGSGVEAGVARIAEAIKHILSEIAPAMNELGQGMPVLLLENDVGGGSSLGYNFEQLRAVLDLLPQYGEHLGVCLDTAHLWGAGHDISSAASAQQVLQHCNVVVGLSRLHVIHLNDTKVALGSHRDVHARLGEGIIGEEGLHALLTDPRLDDVAVLLETPIKLREDGKEDWEHDKQQLELAKRLLMA